MLDPTNLVLLFTFFLIPGVIGYKWGTIERVTEIALDEAFKS